MSLCNSKQHIQIFDLVSHLNTLENQKRIKFWGFDIHKVDGVWTFYLDLATSYCSGYTRIDNIKYYQNTEKYWRDIERFGDNITCAWDEYIDIDIASLYNKFPPKKLSQLDFILQYAEYLR